MSARLAILFNSGAPRRRLSQFCAAIQNCPTVNARLVRTMNFMKSRRCDVVILRRVDGKIAPPFRLLDERPSVRRPRNLIGVDNGPVQAGGRRSGEPFAFWRIDARVDRVARVLFGAQMLHLVERVVVVVPTFKVGHHLEVIARFAAPPASPP